MRSEHTALPISTPVFVAAFSLVWNIRFAYTVERANVRSLFLFLLFTYTQHRSNSILSAECVFTRLCDFTYIHVRLAHVEIAFELIY